MKAELSEDGKTVRIEGRLWRDAFSVEYLPGWIRFYRALAERNRGAYAKHYDATIKALVDVQREVNSR